MKHALPLLAFALMAGDQEKPAAPKVAIVPIVGEIDFRNLALVKRAAREIRDQKPALVLFEIDTPGGRVDHMLSMGEEMMNLAPIPTAAYVRPPVGGSIMGGAISAGSYLAISCKKLYMYPGTVIGAAAPVAQTEKGMEALGEKYVSVVREKFRARAEQNGYPPNLAVAMVDRDMEVFEIVVDGKKLYVTEGEMEKLKAEGKQFDWPKVPFDSKEKLLTLTSRQVAETGMGKVAESRQEIYQDYAISSPVELVIEASWSEVLVGFLTSGIVSTILLVVGILGIWIELKTPGFGLAGVVGVLAIGLLLFGHHLAGLAQWVDIMLIIVGIALIVVELVLFPGVGVFAISGVLCVLAGLMFSLQGFKLPDAKGAPWEVDLFLSSLGRVLVAFLGAGLGFVGLLRFLPKVPILNRLVLETQIAGTAPAPLAAAANGSTLVGRQGHAVTPLRPGGKIEIDGEVHDVVAEGDFVSKGEPVEVLHVEGMRIVVGKLKR